MKQESLKRLIYFFIVFFIAGFNSCQRISTQVPPYLRKVVENVRNIHAPDKRLDLFEIQLKKKGDQLFILGETSSKNLKSILLDSIYARSSYYDIIDSIKVLPEKKLGDKKYGIVYVSVANMRKGPKHSAELVNQILLGTVIKLFKKEGSFYYVQNYDRYLGWVSSSSLIDVDSVEVNEWKNSNHVICTSNYGLMYEQMSPTSEITVDLVPGVILKKIRESGDWIAAETPDKRAGFIHKNIVIDEGAFNNINPLRDNIIETAKSYLGISYLWGGTSTKGFDCSGFVQSVFYMNKFQLPRDANQMVKEGIEVVPNENFSNLLPGDLLFFGPSEERITHVAIYIENQNFIHSDGWVHINSFKKDHPKYNDYRYHTFRKAKRILLK